MSATPQQESETVSVRDRLLNAAETIAARDGVSSLTLDAVAKEAGVSKGGLLYHYPSKSALLIGIVERLACQCEAQHSQSISTQQPCPGAFTRAYLAARTRPKEHREALIQTALLAAAGTDPQYLEPFRQRLQQWQHRLQNDDIDEVTAMIVRLAVDGLCFGEMLGMPVPGGELRQRTLERLTQMTFENQRKD